MRTACRLYKYRFATKQETMLMTPRPLCIRFWGTRGNLPPHEPGTAFGIHTTCVEIRRPGGPPVFVDAGSGLAAAGVRSLEKNQRRFELFLTHLHLDHLNGILSFAPLYDPACSVTIRSGRSDTEAAIRRLFQPPYHPVPFEELAADVTFETLDSRGKRRLEDHGLTVHWGAVPHPQGCTAYRFENDNSAIAFITDVELASRETPDSHLYRLLAEPFPAGLAVIDGFFTDSEIDRFADWGHSSWKQARECAQRAGVETVLVTHHHPAKSDRRLRELEAAADGVTWAREGRIWTVRGNTVEQSEACPSP